MIVGLLFIAFIWCLRGFLSYKQVVHNSCNMGTRGLPDIYTLSPRACGPRALGVYIGQTTHAHVTTIHYCILCGRIKGFNHSITTIMCKDGSTVVLLTHFNKETCLFIQKMC